MATIEPVDDAVLKEMIDEDLIAAHRLRSLEPSRPVIRGTAQNPDVFPGEEAGNRFHDAVPGVVQEEMDRFAAITGRQYRLFDYVGHPEAERVVVLMGSAAGATEAVEALAAAGEGGAGHRRALQAVRQCRLPRGASLPGRANRGARSH